MNSNAAEIFHLPNLCLIAGNGRNSGKTGFAEALISRFSAFRPVIGLKVTSILPGEALFHGSHPDPEAMEGFEIIRETSADGVKDTSRMLRAGAREVYYIRAHDPMLDQAMKAFLSKTGNNALIVCESGSLRSVVRPGVFVLVLNPLNLKSRSLNWKQQADLIVEVNQPQQAKDYVPAICLNENGWQLCS